MLRAMHASGPDATLTVDRAATQDDTAADAPRASLGLGLCPYLQGETGDWRAAVPAREHGCGAVEPPAPIAIDKQRRLCLVPDHSTCTTYLAAREALIADGDAGAQAPGAVTDLGDRGDATRWRLRRTAPVVLDRGGPSLASLRLDRTATQIALVGLMVLAFSILAFARLTAGDPPAQIGGASPTPSATPSARPSASPRPSPRPSPTPAASPAASGSSPAASASPAANASPEASVAGAQTYRVQSGDTLSGIAARFGTTVAELQRLNDIEDPSLIRVGQLLELP
jgi:LysM repeat protein